MCCKNWTSGLQKHHLRVTFRNLHSQTGIYTNSSLRTPITVSLHLEEAVTRLDCSLQSLFWLLVTVCPAKTQQCHHLSTFSYSFTLTQRIYLLCIFYLGTSCGTCSTRLLCLFLFYAAISFHICSNWLLCSASILHAYSVYVYGVRPLCATYTLYGCFVHVYSTWLFCLYSTWVFCASYMLHGNFVYIHSMPALLSIPFSSMPPLQHWSLFILHSFIEVQPWIPLHSIPEALKSILSTAPKITGNYLLAMSNYTFWMYQDPTGSQILPFLLLLGNGYLSSRKAQMLVNITA